MAFAFDAIVESKAKIDRLCVLSIMNQDATSRLVEDHRAIFDCLCRGDGEGIEAALRRHLARIDETIDRVRRNFPAYFV